MNLYNIILSPVSSNNFILNKSVTINGITIPKGYVTNGANIPRIFWMLYPPFKPAYLPAVILHDYLCECALKYKDYQYADEMLKNTMINLNISKFDVFWFYTGCKIYHYLKYRNLK